MTHMRAKPGYAFLVTVLVIGVVAAGAVATLLLLGTSVLRSTLTLESSAKAVERAGACAERVLLNLRADLSYAGNETLTLADGSTCEVSPLSGFGNEERTICVEANDGSVIRRIELSVTQVLPNTVIDRWRDVATFTLCST